MPANNLDMEAFGVVRNSFFALALASCAALPIPMDSPIASNGWAARQTDREELLYVTTIQGRAFMFSYPSGGVAGTFGVGPGQDVWGICAAANGNVFITVQQSTTSSSIYEYAHGGTTPIATLRDHGYVAADCSSDPTTGDLAVTNYDEASNSGDNVAIYHRGRGKPHRYFDAQMSVAFCGYDDRGNLFVDGGGTYELAELAKGSSTLTNIRLSKQLVRPQGVEWDGKQLAIEDGGFARKFSAIDRVRLSGTKGTVVGTTRLGGLANRGATFWFQGGSVLTTGGQQGDRVGLWNYPAGGKVLKLFRGMGIRGESFYGVTVSVAPNRR
jgi:hypothetical protein